MRDLLRKDSGEIKLPPGLVQIGKARRDWWVAEQIEAVCDQEMIELCRKVIVRSFHLDFAHDAE
jgi:hypothetical protein